MPRNRLGLLGIVVVGWGCGSSEKAVYVDIQRVMAADTFAIPLPAHTNPKPPALVKAGQSSIGALPAEIFTFPNVQRFVRDAQTKLKQSQTKAFSRLMANLREAYHAKAVVAADKYRAGVADDSEKILAEALSDLEAEFSRYAAAREEPLTRLAFLQTQDPKRPKIIEEMATLQKTLASLDADHDRQARQILSRVQAYTAGRTAEIDRAIAAIYAKFEAKAQQDAQTYAREIATGIKSELASRGPFRLPAEPGISVKIPGANSVEPVPSIGSLVSDTQVVKRIRFDLNIWLKTKGYVLESRAANGVQDLTQDFIEWRRGRQVGR